MICCRRERLVAVHCTEVALASRLARAIHRAEYPGLSSLQLVSEGKLNSAYVQGETATLWLSGTHRREVVKADNKVLTGLDLRYALDPLGDQTYHFTSVRSRSAGALGGSVVGVTPRRSKAWLGPSRTWTEFASGTDQLLVQLAAVDQENSTPLPILSVPTGDAADLLGAFEVSLTDPEVLGETGDLAPDELEVLRRWTRDARFEVTGQNGHDFTVDVVLSGESIGTLQFALETDRLPRARYQIEQLPVGATSASDSLDEARTLFRKRQLLNVWYESGHTVHDGSVFAIRHRDMPFRDFRWANFSGTDVGREKPDPIEDIGNQDSLFDWVLANWWDPNKDQWLACDDGAMEIADFILFEVGAPGFIELIHVKGAHSASPNRGISVSAYEVVVGQAVKNLRFLDRLLLAEGLSAGMDRRVGDLVWHNRVQEHRAALLGAMGSANANIRRSVIVLQPHVIRGNVNAARANMITSDGRRLRQLDTMLIGARANTAALGATFEVVAEDSA